ncbi:MAG: acetyl-CoA carboxylase carboxyltransferase subunit [Acidimicrobiia bacterium]|nr:acetyl-CoA carboxylase carboxyltransferase subunit [Acidimicrobiia bacterium]
MSEELPGGWGPSLDDLEQRRHVARAMGGEERLARHGSGGKLDARARVLELLDPGSFRELGTLVGDVPADAFVAGTGTIDGRHVMVGAEDFTVVAGTIAGGSNAKRYRLAELALQERVPLVMMLEGAGFRPTDRGHGRSPTDMLMQARCSGSVPIVTAVMGPSAGHGALVAPMSDFTVMTPEASIFTAGPPVVREATGEEIDKADLGGPTVAIPSGLIHALADDDVDALRMVAQYLSYFPSSAWSYPPLTESGDVGMREVPELLSLVPRESRRGYDMRSVIDAVFDSSDWLEVQAGFGKSIICALAHLGGHPVAVVANQPMVIAGSIDSNAADKAAHFITVADSYHLPLVFLSDNPGMLPGSTSERAGVLRSGARMYAAQTLASTTKLHLTLRKAYGFGSMVMAMGAFDHQTSSFAFPGATLGAMSAGASGRAMHADEDQAAALRRAELDASYNSASGLGFDELIDPREARNALLSALRLSLSRRQAPAEPVPRFAITP